MTAEPQTETRKPGATRAPFPHHYEVTLEALAAGAATLAAPPRPAVVGGAPETFGGRDDWWSPEHLLLASLGLCLKTTFDALSARQQLAVSGYESRVHGVLDKTPAGLAFTSFTLDVRLRVAAADAERARRLLDDAKRFCIISNALRTPVDVQAGIEVTQAHDLRENPLQPEENATTRA